MNDMQNNCQNLASLWRIALWIGLAALATLLVTGCASRSRRVVGTGAALPKTQLSREELRDTLNRFEDFFVTSLKQGAAELDTLAPDPKVQRLTLLWRIRCIGALHTLLEQDDPLVALIDAWALSLRMTAYLESGEGSAFFAGHQEVAVATARRIQAEIERIARTLLETSMFEQTQRDLKAFAEANPIRGAFSRTVAYASEVKKGTPGPVQTVVNLPLAPFRAIEGVDRGSAAIRDFSNTAERFSDIVEELPESARWQMLLLLYDLEETQMTRSFLTSLERIAESSTALTETTEKLPAQIRAELSTFVEQVDANQANLQKTLTQTQATSEALATLIERVEAAARALSVTSKDVAETAGAWQATVESIGRTLKKPASSPDANAPSKFDMAELNATARTITAAAVEIRKLNEELAANAGAWSAHTERLTTSIAWKLGLLIALTFILAVLYRLVTLRLARARPPERAAS